MEYHEISTVFSSFEDTEEYRGLVDSIKCYGLFDPILVWQDKIVDGRHRHKACLEAGVEPEYQILDSDMPFEMVKDRVIAENILRRHLTTGQRAMIAASLANMTVGGTGSNQYEKSNRANSPDSTSNKDAAKSLNVGERTVKDAKEVKRDAPDLAEKVSRGEMSLNAAKTESRERTEQKRKEMENAPNVFDLNSHIKSTENCSVDVSAVNLVVAMEQLVSKFDRRDVMMYLHAAIEEDVVNIKIPALHEMAGILTELCEEFPLDSATNKNVN